MKTKILPAPATFRNAPYHHFTVDVEEYFQVSALEGVVDRSTWDRLPSRVVDSTLRLLDLLSEYKATGTFFTLGWVAARHPQLVREIAARGHEIASHGSDHRRVTQQTPEEFRASVRESKMILEEVSGQSVLGFRAPSFSIVHGREWALEILLEEGYVYDSSLYPVRRRGYGYVGVPVQPCVIGTPAGDIIEFPPATLQVAGLSLPAGGGAYLRLLPPAIVHAGMKQAQAAGFPATFYIHPWEIDPDQPRFDVSWLTSVRHYGGLRANLGRTERLVRRFAFRPISQTLSPAFHARSA